MNSDTFERIFAKQIERSKDILVTKAGEYASEDDRLHNFDVAAALKGETPQQALAGFMAKHTVSIYDMCRAPDGTFTTEQWDEKITDHVNYLIILKAIVQESIWNNEVSSGQLNLAGNIMLCENHPDNR